MVINIQVKIIVLKITRGIILLLKRGTKRKVQLNGAFDSLIAMKIAAFFAHNLTLLILMEDLEFLLFIPLSIYPL